MAGPLITTVWITDKQNIFAATEGDPMIPIGSSESPSAKEFLKAFRAGIPLDLEDARAAQRVSRSESGDAGPKAWAPQWTARSKKKHLEMAFRLEKKVYRKIKEDYAAMLGRPILVSEFSGYRDAGSVDFNLDPPALVQVTQTPEQDLFHYAGDGWIDPYWDLELLEPHEGLENVRGLWMFGTSYNLKTGKTSPARFRFADEA